MDESRADRAARLAHDWATIWQSELAALGADPETGYALEATFAAWLRAVEFWRNALNDHDSAGRGDGGRRVQPRADAPAGTAPAAAAPEPGHDAVAALERRLAELERRLTELGPDRGGDGQSGAAGA